VTPATPLSRQARERLARLQSSTRFASSFAQSFLHVIDVAAPDVETAEDIAWDSYHGDHHRCGDRCAKGEAEVIDTVEVQS
jgi:hypothetical protein